VDGCVCLFCAMSCNYVSDQTADFERLTRMSVVHPVEFNSINKIYTPCFSEWFYVYIYWDFR
jgi:hypothetical protein